MKEDLKGCVVEALFILLKKEPFAEVGIEALVKRAGVSKDFFYKHFQTKEKVIEHFFGMIRKNYPAEKSRSYDIRLEKFLNHLLRYKDNLLLLHKNNLTYLLQASINRDFLALRKSEKVSFEEEHKLLAYASNFYNLLSLWLSYGMIQSPKELLEKTKIADVEHRALDDIRCVSI